MSKGYTIEQLEKTFKKHAEDYIEYEKKRCEGTSVYIENFNISEALYVICKEINQLKREIKYGKTFQRFKSGDA